MRSQLKSSHEYYLGIGGEQLGPFNHSQLIAKLKEGTVPPDALYWYEGMGDWQPVETLPEYQAALKGEETPEPEPVKASAPRETAAPTSPPKETRKPKSQPAPVGDGGTAATYASGPTEPVFSAEEAIFEKSIWVRHRAGVVIGVAVCIVVSLAALINYRYGRTFNGNAALRKKVPKRSASSEVRERDLRKALSEILIRPDAALPILTNIAKADSNDAAGKEAVQAVVDYYKQSQRPSEAGKFLLEVRQPVEAAKLLLASASPATAQDLEIALHEAFKVSTGAEQKQFLLEDIKVLLSPLNNTSLATERVKLFEKNYPGESHPYGFYLLSNDEKIRDLFNRLSFYYVELLLKFLHDELPQINLKERPRVSITKDKEDRYRVVGNYRGEVRLNQDRMPDVLFTFWLYGDKWAIVETNLTPEREKFAKEEKAAHLNETISAQELLRQMETMFKSQFPKNALHESVNEASRQKKAIAD